MADHISIEKCNDTVTVILAGVGIAKTDQAVWLKEGAYPPVLYLPRESLVAHYFQASDHKTHCPYKGDASYLHALVDGKRGENCAWSYENPKPAVAEIEGYVAFYPDRVDAVNITP